MGNPHQPFPGHHSGPIAKTKARPKRHREHSPETLCSHKHPHLRPNKPCSARPPRPSPQGT
eukprot:12631080-Heterocapsa_arctica.AAC.1